MTVPVQTPYNSHLGNGVTNTFAYTFKLLLAADLVVRVAGVELVTGFSITGLGVNGGGNVVFVAPPASLAEIEFFSRTQLKRDTDYQNAGEFPAATVNADVDRVWLALRDQGADIARSLKLPIGTVDDQEVTPIPGRAVVIDDDGNLAMSASDYLGNEEALNDAIAGAQAAATTATTAAGTATSQAASATASAAAAAASAASINPADLVHRTGAETIGGVKTFTSKPLLPSNASAALEPVPLQQFNAGPGGGQHSHRNLLVNANFAVNQRAYVSGTATVGANQYTLDMWRVVVSGESLVFANLGLPTVNFANQVTAPAGGLEQVVPGENVQGGTYTLSWVGAGTATVNGVSRANGSSFNLPGGTNATVRFVGAVSYAQLEPGGASTTFEYLPYELNLHRCERFYEIGESVANGYAIAGQSISHREHFRVRKYRVPTLGYASSGAVNAAVFDARNPTADGLEWFAQAAATGNVAFSGTWIASAEP